MESLLRGGNGAEAVAVQEAGGRTEAGGTGQESENIQDARRNPFKSQTEEG